MLSSAPVSIVRVTRSWGSHGVSVYGEYWTRWRGSASEEMDAKAFTKEAAELVAGIDKDCQEMVRGDQRAMFGLELELEVIDGPLF